jgi:hypothetical protein
MTILETVIFGVVRSSCVMWRYEDGQRQQLTVIIWTDIIEIFVLCGLLRLVNLIVWAFDVILCEIFEANELAVNS